MGLAGGLLKGESIARQRALENWNFLQKQKEAEWLNQQRALQQALQPSVEEVKQEAKEKKEYEKALREHNLRALQYQEAIREAPEDILAARKIEKEIRRINKEANELSLFLNKKKVEEVLDQETVNNIRGKEVLAPISGDILRNFEGKEIKKQAIIKYLNDTGLTDFKIDDIRVTPFEVQFVSETGEIDRIPIKYFRILKDSYQRAQEEILKEQKMLKGMELEERKVKATETKAILDAIGNRINQIKQSVNDLQIQMLSTKDEALKRTIQEQITNLRKEEEELTKKMVDSMETIGKSSQPKEEVEVSIEDLDNQMEYLVKTLKRTNPQKAKELSDKYLKLSKEGKIEFLKKLTQQSKQ